MKFWEALKAMQEEGKECVRDACRYRVYNDYLEYFDGEVWRRCKEAVHFLYRDNWQLVEEPKEFWVNLGSRKIADDDIVFIGGKDWIRVREVK